MSTIVLLALISVVTSLIPKRIYRFEQNALDSSYNLKHGTPINNLSYGTGNCSDAVEMTSHAITIPRIEIGETISILSVFKLTTPAGVGQGRYLYFQALEGEFSLGFEVGALYFTVNMNAAFYSAEIPEAMIPLNQYVHVIGVFDNPNKEGRIYLNGALIDTVVLPAGSIYRHPPGLGCNDPPHLPCIGCTSWCCAPPTCSNFIGSIEEMRFYDEAITDEEALEMFISDSGCECPEGYYGPNCDYTYFCWDRQSNIPGVCSGHGTCVGVNDCECDDGYYGNRCQGFKCDGIDSEHADVCNGFGKCVDTDTCVCDTYFSTTTTGCDTCNNKMCNGVGTCSVDSAHSYSCTGCPVLISGPTCDVCDVSGKIGVHMDGICYFNFPGIRKTWQDARTYCKKNHHAASDLAVISDDRAQSAFRAATGGRSSWILLSDGASHGVWEWKDGVTPLTFTQWNLYYPKSYKGNCAFIHKSKGVWMNQNCLQRHAASSLTCALAMSDFGNAYSSNPLLNVGWKKYDFSSGWCDWTVALNCPDEFKECNGVLESSPNVCNFMNGTCEYNAAKKENLCNCNAGWEGLDCEEPDVPISGEECDSLNGYCYKYYDVKLSWNKAREYCKANWDPAADLAIIRDEDVQEIVSNMAGTKGGWIGALDFVEGQTEWVDHSPMNYLNFIVKDDGGQFGEDCVEMKGNFWIYKSQWSTSNCATRKRFICGLKIEDAGQSWSSNGWINVEYQKLNTNQATCTCDGRGGGPCPSCGCTSPCP